MTKRNFLTSIFKFTNLLVNARVAYENAKQDENIRKNITTFGKRAIGYNIAFLLLCGLGIGLVWFGITNFLNMLLLGVLAIIGGIMLIVYSLPLLILCLNLLIKQLILNKKPLGWIALVLFILTILAIVGLLIFLFAILPRK